MKKIVNGYSGVARVAVIIMREHVYMKITKLNNFTGFRRVTLNVWVLHLIYPKHMCVSMEQKQVVLEALLIMLRRLTYPNRWCDLVRIFGRAEPELSVIFNKVT